MEVQFTWRPEKAKRNLTKHHISFETAKQVFFDPHVIIVDDCEDDGGDIRYHAIGYTDAQLLLLVVFMDQSKDGREIIHIISARKATDYEQSAYSDQFQKRN